jgi:phosphoglycerate dehydrogenase-like enzyme
VTDGANAPSSGPLRILLSAKAKSALAARVAAVMRGRPFELLAFEDDDDGADVAYVSRDVTGLSTKHELTESTRQAHDLLRRSPRLAWVQTHSAGVDRPIFIELRQRGVIVTSSSGSTASVVAQSALAGLLSLARHFPQLMAAQRERRWAPLIGGPMPRDLGGQTATIVGWGPVGQQIGGVLQMLGLSLIVVRQGDDAAGPGIETLRFDQWRSALPHTDWLVLACPLSDATRGLVDAHALALLRPGARLINVARGEVVVEAALIAALQSDHLSGAYLDVFEHEPLAADSPLWSLPNVIATPHSAGHSDGNQARVDAFFLDNLQRWRDAKPLINVAP